MINLKGKFAMMDYEDYHDLKNRDLILVSGEQEFLLYSGFAYIVVINSIETNEKPSKGV